MNKDKVGYLLLDFETGGLDPIHDRHYPLVKGNPILSVGVILLDEDLQLIDWHYSLIKPAHKDSQGQTPTYKRYSSRDKRSRHKRLCRERRNRS